MRPPWEAALVALLLAGAAALPTALADETVDEGYRLGTGPVQRAVCEGPAAGTGGACFAMREASEDVHLVAEDELGEPVAFEWRLEDEEGRIGYGSGVVCGDGWILEPDPEDFPVQRIRVTVLAPAFAAHVCPVPAFGAQGTITATFLPG